MCDVKSASTINHPRPMLSSGKKPLPIRLFLSSRDAGFVTLRARERNRRFLNVSLSLICLVALTECTAASEKNEISEYTKLFSCKSTLVTKLLNKATIVVFRPELITEPSMGKVVVSLKPFPATASQVQYYSRGLNRNAQYVTVDQAWLVVGKKMNVG